MKIKFIAVVICFILTGCGGSGRCTTDKPLNQKLFFQCLDHLPKGLGYGELGSAVKECRSWASLEAFTCRQNVTETTQLRSETEQ